MNEPILLELIENAFLHRLKPKEIVRADAPLTDVYQDAATFHNKEWQSIECEELDKYPAALSGFTPEAFCYFLPGVFSAGIREKRVDLYANSILISMLDRGNGPSSWDDFFIERWCSLNSAECSAVQHWVMWLSSVDPPEFTDSELSRAFDTLEILANNSIAVPIASHSPRIP